MHLQTLFVVAFAVICGVQCLPRNKIDGWNFDDSHYQPDDDNDDYNKGSYEGKSSRKGFGVDGYDDRYEDDDDSYDRKSSYRKKYDDDDDSYDRKPSYDKYDDDDDDSYDNRPSRKGYDKYDNSDEDYGDDYEYKKHRPSKRSYKPKDVGHMNIYFREPSKDGKRKKSKRFRFPTAHYERDHYPKTFGPLMSFMPWVPIFADRFTKQTIINSPTGGVYILPPVINFYGDLISVAELIASGYASLVSTGAPPPPAVDVAPLVQPSPVVGPGVPTVDPSTGGFKGGVRTQYRSFPRPSYDKNYEEKSSYSQKDGYSKPSSGY